MTVPEGSAPAVALNVALVWPAGMTTEAGTVRAALLEFRVTITELVLVPPIPAVHVVDPLLATVDGVQDKLLNCVL